MIQYTPRHCETYNPTSSGSYSVPSPCWMRLENFQRKASSLHAITCPNHLNGLLLMQRNSCSTLNSTDTYKLFFLFEFRYTLCYFGFSKTKRIKYKKELRHYLFFFLPSYLWCFISQWDKFQAVLVTTGIKFWQYLDVCQCDCYSPNQLIGMQQMEALCKTNWRLVEVTESSVFSWKHHKLFGCECKL